MPIPSASDSLSVWAVIDRPAFGAVARSCIELHLLHPLMDVLLDVANGCLKRSWARLLSARAVASSSPDRLREW